jgi:hypothetical protein
MLQQRVKHGILMAHGIVPLRVPVRRQRRGMSRFSAVRFVKHKMYRTTVDSVPAIHVFGMGSKTWIRGPSPRMTTFDCSLRWRLSVPMTINQHAMDFACP